MTQDNLLRTLEAIASEDPLNDWIFSRIEPHARGRILEVGCGIGTFTKRLVERGTVVAIDPWPAAIERCRATLDGKAEFFVGEVGSLPEQFRSDFNSVICLNVLEHIEDDLEALKAMRSLLEPGGRLILLVPAGAWLYGSLDRAFGHFRRYRKQDLSRRLEQAGLIPERLGHFNLLGVPGWLVGGKILRLKNLGRRLLRLYRILMPPFRWLEDHLRIPLGLSLLAVARRPKRPGQARSLDLGQ